MPNPSIVPITQPRVPFLNPETGFVSMPWYRFLLSLSQLTGGSEVSLGDLQKGPPQLTIDEINSIIDRASAALDPSQDGLLAQIAELQKQVQAQELYDCCNALISQVAELQKQIEGLQAQPVVSQGAMTSGTSILYGDGSGGFSNVNIGTGVAFTGGTLSATGSGGTVTSVTGTSPVASSGGATPAISLASGYGDTQNPYASKTANNFLAAPNGAAGVPTFRAMVAADVPTLPYNPTAAPATYAANFTVAATDVWIINNKSGSSCVVTLPTPSTNTGRVLYFQNYQNQTLVSASSNVVQLTGGAATTAILQAMSGATATLVSNGTSWIMMQYSSNNAL